MKFRALLILFALSACEAPPAAEEPRAPSISLADSRWVLIHPDAPANTQLPTIEFSTEDRASGFSGCNQWFAQTDDGNGGLRFSAVGMTRRACPEPAMGIERDFGAMLEHTRSAELDGADLVLFGEEAEEIGRFSPLT